jgi:hypothetical protein
MSKSNMLNTATGAAARAMSPTEYAENNLHQNNKAQTARAVQAKNGPETRVCYHTISHIYTPANVTGTPVNYVIK